MLGLLTLTLLTKSLMEDAVVDPGDASREETDLAVDQLATRLRELTVLPEVQGWITVPEQWRLGAVYLGMLVFMWLGWAALCASGKAPKQ